MAILAPTASALQLGLINDFQDGLQGWQGFQPQQVASGGPAGDGDAYLQITADGEFGSGSKLATYNFGADWSGDFKSLGATAIDLDMKVETTSAKDINLRLVLFGPTDLSNRWSSTDDVIVPRDGLWHHVSFPIDATSILRVQGNSSFDAMLQNVVRVMFRHDTDPAGSQGAAVKAVAGIDNITIVGPPLSTSPDLNRDGVADVRDIDLLISGLRGATTDTQFDINLDGRIDQDDLVELVTAPDQFNTYVGDSNLDGVFDTTDLVDIFVEGQYEDDATGNSTWATGDWSGDGEFDTNDLLLAFQLGGFEQSPRAAVPEPATSILLLTAALGALGHRRRQPLR